MILIWTDGIWDYIIYFMFIHMREEAIRHLYKFGLVEVHHFIVGLYGIVFSANMTSRAFPSRHKVQQEEEDAAALKLGPGTF